MPRDDNSVIVVGPERRLVILQSNHVLVYVDRKDSSPLFHLGIAHDDVGALVTVNASPGGVPVAQAVVLKFVAA